MSKVVIRSTKEKTVESVVQEIMDVIDWQSIVKKDARVVIKPNLCWYKEHNVHAANTSAEVLDAVIKVLIKRTRNIAVCESDGTRFSADTCLGVSNYAPVLDKHGVKWVNLSQDKDRINSIKLLDKNGYSLNRILLEADVRINLPVLKTHALTEFTGAAKNLWGCVPRHDRIFLHRYLNFLLSELVQVLRPQINIMDGIWGMEGRGPVNGKPIKLDLLLGSTDPIALDVTAMRLVGLDPKKAKHLVLSAEHGFAFSEDQIKIDGDFARYKCEIEPAKMDFVVSLMNYCTRYRFFTYRILLNDRLFFFVRSIVMKLREKGLL